ncbi:MAG: PspC domain-containing protein [Clostridia bacterium]|nr:PspC domain-containing protein [Clostridia bacterium]
MKTLTKSKTNRKICGVCGGIGEYLGVDPTLVRLIFAGCVIVFGSGLLAYIVAAIIMPEG